MVKNGILLQCSIQRFTSTGVCVGWVQSPNTSSPPPPSLSKNLCSTAWQPQPRALHPPLSSSLISFPSSPFPAKTGACHVGNIKATIAKIIINYFWPLLWCCVRECIIYIYIYIHVYTCICTKSYSFLQCLLWLLLYLTHTLPVPWSCPDQDRSTRYCKLLYSDPHVLAA